ncbi:MAG: hypothetical protein WCC63_08245 [Candidatus Bathyarchaeia archaeon]
MGAFDIMMVALRLGSKINRRRIEGLMGLMTDDHMFIDNFRAVDEDVNDGWRGFLENHLITGRVHVGKSEKWGFDGDFTSFL